MSKQQNRERMPEIAAVVDQCRKFFGPTVKVEYAKENGIEIGTQPEGEFMEYLPGRHAVMVRRVKTP